MSLILSSGKLLNLSGGLLSTGAGGGGGDASAPTIGTAIQYGPRGAAIHFKPGASPGSTNITGYRTYVRQSGVDISHFDTSSVRLQDEGNTNNWQQLNCRTEANGLTDGGVYTFQVAAINVAGVSPNRSADSNSVTALTLGNYYMVCGGGMPGLNPDFSDYSFGEAELQYNVAPGTASTTPITGFNAPTNPGTSTDNVLEFGISSGQNGATWFPHIGHQSLSNTFDSTQNGRFNIAPFTNIIVKVWPTQSGMSVFPNQLAACLWVNGVVTTGGTGTFTDATQTAPYGNPGWPTNILNGSLVWNLSTGQNADCTGNTGTQVTGIGSVVFSVGDYYEISIPDVGIGASLGAQSPSPMTANSWNTFVIPLANFNGGSTAYTNIYTAPGQILKSQVAFNAPSGNAVMYICQHGFS
jgi:hypothetical protein